MFKIVGDLLAKVANLINNASMIEINDIKRAKEKDDYFNWNGFCLPNAYGDENLEYKAVRSTCALFDPSPINKYRVSGADAGASNALALKAVLNYIPSLTVKRGKSEFRFLWRALYGINCEEMIRGSLVYFVPAQIYNQQ